jgi:hypothetical protein
MQIVELLKLKKYLNAGTYLEFYADCRVIKVKNI